MLDFNTSALGLNTDLLLHKYRVVQKCTLPNVPDDSVYFTYLTLPLRGVKPVLRTEGYNVVVLQDPSIDGYLKGKPKTSRSINRLLFSRTPRNLRKKVGLRTAPLYIPGLVIDTKEFERSYLEGLSISPWHPYPFIAGAGTRRGQRIPDVPAADYEYGERYERRIKTSANQNESYGD